ncbi:ABC transporter ATP-binding protein [Salinimicrobium sp. CAU 1759]
MSTILKAENISKQYRLGLVGSSTLNDDFKRWWYRVRGKEDPFLKVGAVNDRSTGATEDYVWALRDINFEVKQGEVLGIIGKNGAGKSTLLKLLSRVTAPTTGSIKTRGRIASLLEVGTGFHGELTGRENIFMNGAVLGMTKTEIRTKLDEIIAFSGCEKYIDTPVKRYSSGMTVRLGFAVAAHLEPEVLVVDEVLAVGDAEFQKKAIGKMQDLSKGEGRTVLFVSHSMKSIKNLCSRAVVLENGGIVRRGEIVDCVDFYLNRGIDKFSSGKKEFHSEYIGDENLQLTEVLIKDKMDRLRTSFSQSEEINIEIMFRTFVKLQGARFNLSIRTTDAEDVFVTSSHLLTKRGIEVGEQILFLTIPSNLLNEKKYNIVINAGIPGIKVIVPPTHITVIEVFAENSGGSDFVEKWPGVVAPRITWKLR